MTAEQIIALINNEIAPGNMSASDAKEFLEEITSTLEAQIDALQSDLDNELDHDDDDDDGRGMD